MRQAPTLCFSVSDCQPFSIYPIALFGQTAKQWREANPGAEGNLRDHAPFEQIVVLTNLESLNPVLIRQGLPQPVRLATLNAIAITQMLTLLIAWDAGLNPIPESLSRPALTIERRPTRGFSNRHTPPSHSTCHPAAIC